MLFSSFWKRGPGPPLWGPGGSLDPWTPPGSAPGVYSYTCSMYCGDIVIRVVCIVGIQLYM